MLRVITRQHLQADECKQCCQTHFQVTELIDNIHQQKEHGTQTEDGKYVGEENDIRIFGDRKNCRNGIHRENKVGDFDDE